MSNLARSQCSLREQEIELNANQLKRDVVPVVVSDASDEESTGTVVTIVVVASVLEILLVSVSLRA